MKIFKTIKELFHTHTIIWKTRKKIGNVSIDFTGSGPMVDIVPGTRYLVKGYCAECHQNVTKIYEIADMFDQPQPYDKEV